MSEKLENRVMLWNGNELVFADDPRRGVAGIAHDQPDDLGELIAQAWNTRARKQQDLKNVVCPQCGKVFRLTWNDYSDTPETLVLRGCPSGGIYDVKISCPHCDYEEEL